MASGLKPIREVEPAAAVLAASGVHSLAALEKLDRSSPELWPELIPGVTEYYKPMSQRASNKIGKELEELWSQELDDNELILLRKYSNMPRAALIAKIKEIHDVAYELGLQEAKEMTRGRMLEIFENKRQRS